ncbi:MAG: M48 family metallopeptidase [Blastocatellales bacterium]
MKAPVCENIKSIELSGHKLEYRLVVSKSARYLRVRVGVNGVEVVQPQSGESKDVAAFLRENEKWLTDQLKRIEGFRKIRRPQQKKQNEILYRGEKTPVQVKEVAHRRGANQITFENGRIEIVKGHKSLTPPKKSLENWLRKRARIEIERQLESVTRKLKLSPNKVYVMGQRTKWGNCSGKQNLSFNWRLIMAPEYVMKYLVIHEAVHLAVPDHSQKFWLTVKSLCPEMEKAKRWLCVHGEHLRYELDSV